jgi:hypothetical protein
MLSPEKFCCNLGFISLPHPRFFLHLLILSTAIRTSCHVLSHHCVPPVPSLYCIVPLLPLASAPITCHVIPLYNTPFLQIDYTLKMKAASFSETWIPLYQSIWCHIPQDWNLHQHCCVKLRCFHILCFEKPSCLL